MICETDGHSTQLALPLGGLQPGTVRADPVESLSTRDPAVQDSRDECASSGSALVNTPQVYVSCPLDSEVTPLAVCQCAG